MAGNELAVWGIGGTTGVALLVWLIKHLVVTVFGTKNEIANYAQNEKIAERLANEISRLEEIIEKQNRKIAELDAKMDGLRRIELADFADIAELAAIVETTCVGRHGCPSDVRLKAILERMKQRHMEAH
jgi:predicted nuclease with TOPRIM domain